MKNQIGLAVAIAICIMSCNRVPNKDVKAANERVLKADKELKDAKLNKEKATKSQTEAEWNYFKNESDTALSNMEKDLKNLEVKLIKTNTKGNEELKKALVKAKSDLKELRNKLHQKNIAFRTDLGNFNGKMYEKNESFKREFEHDMTELSKAIKDLFKKNTN